MCHSWIVSMFRHCNASVINVGGPGRPSDLQCPSAAALAAFEKAVALGDIGWHAFPFNAEPEVYDSSLFMAALNLTFIEDAHFGHSKRRTYSQRDVPGPSSRKTASCSIRRALLMLQINTGSLYCCGKRT